MLQRLHALYDKTQWFNAHDAWALFRVAAFGEAFGWTLLIFGVLYDIQKWPQYHDVLIVAGRLHGTFFALYIIATVLLSRSLGWRWFWIVIALGMSVPPYGTLLFEQLLARTRYKNSNPSSAIYIRLLCQKGGATLLVQSPHEISWHLPGRQLKVGETPKQAARQFYNASGGSNPRLLTLVAVYTYRIRRQQRQEFIYEAPPVNTPAIGLELDDAGYLAATVYDVRPRVLQTPSKLPFFIKDE